MLHRLVRRIAPAPWAGLVCLAVWGTAACAAPTTWYRVLSESESGVELELLAPPPVTGENGLRLPGFEAGGEAGRPEVFEQTLVLGVPGPHGAQLELTDLQQIDLGQVPPRIVPEPVSWAERHAAAAAGRPVEEWRDVAAAPLTSIYPAQTVALDGVARLRGHDIVTVHFWPVQYHPGGRVTCVQRVRVRVRFLDRARVREDTALLVPDPMHAGLVNTVSAARWESADAPAPAGRRTTAVQDLPLQRLRIRIGARGLYELTYADLKAAGVPVDRVNPPFDPRTFRLYFDSWKSVPLGGDSIPSSWQSGWQMSEAAIWIPGEADGGYTSDDPGDRILFYALGPEGWEDLAGASADSLAYYRHPFDRSQYAWLLWDGDFGARMSVAAVGVPDSSTAPSVSRTWHREHFERDVAFDAVDDLWYWDEIRPTRAVQITFALDLAGAALDSGMVRVALGSVESGRHVIDMSLLGGPSLGQSDFYSSVRAQRTTTLRVPLRASNTLVLTSNPLLDSSRATNLLEFDVAWPRPLAVRADSTLGWSARPGSRGEEIYGLAGFATRPPQVFDVTNPLQPVRLTGLTQVGEGSGVGYRFLHGRGAGQRAHYYAAAHGIDVQAASLTLRTVTNLRGITSAPDILIVTDEKLRPAANRLATHRRTHFSGRANPDILVISTTDIYENFSGGRQDPLAIRNFAKFLYRLEAAPRLGYLLLFGDGNRDSRQIVPASAATMVPALEPGYLDPALNRDNSAYAVDDWFAEFDTPHNGQFSAPYPVPDVAIGRLAARNAGDATRIVDKIIAYETTSGFGPWRARVLLVADDECHTAANCSEDYHTYGTEDLAAQVPRDLEAYKFYMTEYPAVLGQKPSARAAFIRTWNEGCVLLNYQGHGAPRQLADEVLFLSTDIPSLVNGSRLPIFMPISCSVGEFDDPEQQSMCEDLISSASGGAIASIGATTPTYVPTNLALNISLFDQLFASGATSHVPLGVVVQVAKSTARTSNGRYNEPYVLLADPSMSLVLPHALVRFTSGADSLATGHRARVQGEIYDPADSLRLANFDGQAEVVVLGTDDTSGYRRPAPSPLYIAYDLPGSPIYRGTVPVADGRFSFDCIVPLGARPGGKARIRAYASSPSLDATGQRPNIVVRVAAAEDSSLGPPRIRLRFPSDRTYVKAGTVLTAEIQDENGINIQGTSLRNSIYLDFDGKNDPLDVTAQFRYAAGSDSAGTVSVPLPTGLDPGAHSALLLASDNLLNTGSAKLDFQVVEEQAVRLVNVLAFPNPFRDWTRFFFEITDPAEVEVEVFTSSGRPVWHHRQHFDSGAQGSIKWDGVDLAEDTIGNGTYLFRLRAHPDRAGAPTLEHIGKVVVMR